MTKQKSTPKAGLILFAGIMFNLSIGVLNAWSVIKAKLTAPPAAGGWAWTSKQAGLPYSTAIICFALGLLIGGAIQDKIGPRRVVTLGGVLTGGGLILAGLQGDSVWGMISGFGLVNGLGIGFGYGCVTPTALKWFHPSKKGLVSGLIVGGFSLAAVYFAPLTNTLLSRYGIQNTLILVGAAIIIVSTPCALSLRNPPANYLPPAPRQAAYSVETTDFTWREMLKTKRFYLLFIMFLFPSSVGLMIVGNMAKIANIQAGVTNTALLALLVSLLSLTNTLGRVLGGLMSDKIGGVNALLVVFCLQALNMAGFIFYRSLATLIVGIIAAGFSYGTLISVFPSLTAANYGLKNYGANYGVLFLAWGMAGVVAPLLADFIYDANGNFLLAYVVAALMMILMIAVNILSRTKPPAAY